MIKTSNDLLGFLIKRADEDGDVPASVILGESGLDGVSLIPLIDELKDRHYIVYSTDCLTVTALGRSRYLPVWQRVLGKVFGVVKAILGFISGLFVAFIIFGR